MQKMGSACFLAIFIAKTARHIKTLKRVHGRPSETDGPFSDGLPFFAKASCLGYDVYL
ncbi:hypothetical protein ACTHT4_01380 [Neisseria sp. P0022.S007]|uniref:hypothetical protein n=1 Tax=Neisseria TaxID=482 RepID=UPI00131EB970|nr:hypothetical protein [Neisseria subflava]